MLYNVLKATGHSSTVLKILKPGVETSETPLPNSPAKLPDKDEAYLLALENITKSVQQTSAQITDFRADIQSRQDEMASQLSSIKSELLDEITGLRKAMDRIGNLEKSLKLETMSREDLKKVVQSLLQEFTTYKEEYRKTAEKIDKLEKRGSNDDEILNKFIGQLKDIGSHGDTELWQEIVKLKQGMTSLRKWSQANWEEMQARLNTIEQKQKVRFQSHPIQETDIQDSREGSSS
ncbi:uncharacterized protein LOC102804775 isoform X2 [Saccoglossus kowalevskii]